MVDTPFEFPPFKERDSSPQLSSLKDVLGHALDRDDWNGIPDARALALALSKLIDGKLPKRRKQHIVEDLIEVTAQMLEGGSADGYRLNLTGKSGHRSGFAEEDRAFAIGEFMREAMERGEKYNVACKLACEKFSCGPTVAGREYSALKASLELDRDWMRQLLEEAQRKLDSMKSGDSPEPL